MNHPRLAWFVAACIARMLVRLRVEGRRTIPPGPAVIVANHQSWIDPLLVIAGLGRGRPIVFIAAREHIEKRRLFARLFNWAGITILVDRASVHQRETLRAAHTALTAGGSLALFPEGKVNFTDAPLLPLEPGTAAIARRAGAWIVPVGLAGSRELHWQRRVTLAVGTPFAPGTSRQDDDEVTARLQEGLLAALPPTPPLGRVQPGAWLRRLT